MSCCAKLCGYGAPSGTTSWPARQALDLEVKSPLDGEERQHVRVSSDDERKKIDVRVLGVLKL